MYRVASSDEFVQVAADADIIISQSSLLSLTPRDIAALVISVDQQLQE